MRSQRRKRLIGAIVIALAGVSGVLAVRAVTSAPIGPQPIQDEFDHIRDGGGLFFRPEALDERRPSMADTAYGLAILSAAGQSAALPRQDQAFTSLLSATVQSSPVWGRWYALRIEEASGARLPGDWASSLVDSLNPSGYFKDDPHTPDDLAAALATTAGALEVVDHEKLVLTSVQRGSLTTWLTSVATRLANPYQACNLLRSMQSLERPDPALATTFSSRWPITNLSSLPPPNSFEQVLDLYGQACLTVRTPGMDPTPVKQALKRALAGPATDLQISYYLADAWRMLGGPKEDLLRLAAAVPGRRDPASGLVNAALVRQGSLESSYYVMRIRRLRGTSWRDERLVRGVKAEIDRQGASAGQFDLLFAAAILKENNSSDQALEQRAVAAARGPASHPVIRETARGWVTLVDLLDELGVVVPEAEVRPWPAVSEDDRILVWQVIARKAHLRTQTIPPAFTDTADSIPRALADAGKALPALELLAGAEALKALGRADRVPAAVLENTLAGRLGCPRFRDLYRPSAPAQVCDLPETVHALSLSVSLAGAKGGNR